MEPIVAACAVVGVICGRRLLARTCSGVALTIAVVAAGVDLDMSGEHVVGPWFVLIAAFASLALLAASRHNRRCSHA